MALALIGVLLVALIVGAAVTLIIITVVGADRKLRKARRSNEGKQ